MAKYTTKQIRNVCLLGHSGSGKTSLVEAMLYMTKGTDRLGTPTAGNTISDFDPEEIKRGFSLSTSVEPVLWKDVKINVLDTPGFLDFAGEVNQAVRVADAAIIVIDARSGVEVGAELAWDYATDAGIPKAFFINKFDDPEAHFTKLFDELREKFGHNVCPLFLPMRVNGSIEGFLNLIDMKTFVYDANGHHKAGEIPADFADVAADYKNMLLESLAETSDELMEKFFAEEEITRDEAVEALHTGIISGSIVPVICGSSTKLWSIEEMLDIIADSFPRHTAKKNEKVTVGGETKDLPIEGTSDVNLFVFKTIADQFGKQTFFKVMTGELNNTMTLRNVDTGASEKMAHIFTVCGKKQTEVDSLSCGDIGMIPKLTNTNTNDTLTSGSGDAALLKITYPEGFYSRALSPKSKGDEDKISTGVNRLLEEDKTLKFKNDPETNQLVVTGLGDMQLSILSARLESRNKVAVDLVEPKIAYREAIKKRGVQVQGKHKKQSGGHGQYGDVRITFGPGPEGTEGLTFTESVVGGAVPKGYFPAVEKGLQEAMQKGILAGFPMVNLSADLYDGSYHDVDSSEMAFKLAANLAYKAAMPIANPVILEPIGTLNVFIPESMLGDAMGDLNKRRGRIMGTNPMEGKKGYTVLEAEVPFSEMTDYTIALRAMTQGKGRYTLYFVRYEEVPAIIAQKIIEIAKREAEAEK